MGVLPNNRICRYLQINFLSPKQIYDKCIENPISIIIVPLNKTLEIADLLGITYTEEQLTIATIARKIYQNTIDKAWTGTPSKYILNTHKNVTKQMLNILKDQYKIIGEMFTLYLEYNYLAEVNVSNFLVQKVKDNSIREYTIEPDFEQLNINITDEQKFAVKNGLNKSLSIISGGAGTGKTTIIKSLSQNCERLGISYAITGFTGKSIARIKEIIGNNVPMTMHMMINRARYIKPFMKLYLDEISMVNIDLFYNFIRTFGTDYDVCLLGDVNQLFPISWGNLFSELINSNILEPIYLTKNHRIINIETKNNLIDNSIRLIDHYKALKYRDPDDFIEPFHFDTNENFFILDGGLETVYEIVKLLYNQSISPKDITIITPYVKCLSDINIKCQSVYNLNTRYVTCSKGLKWCITDRVMVTSNNYSLNLMNGDEGTIVDVLNEAGKLGFPEILVEFKSGLSIKFLVTYDNTIDEIEDLNESSSTAFEPTLSLLIHCYAMTIHKSQGSEYQYVIGYLPSDNKSSGFINFNLMYTWITRAKRAFWMVGNRQYLEINATMAPPFRHDNLCQRLKKLMNIQ